MGKTSISFMSLKAVREEKSFYDEINCIHPDLEGKKTAPRHFVRGNILSPVCKICNFCGFACRKPKGLSPAKKSQDHFIGANFIYCPEQGKAFKASNVPAGEICSPELGGCGCAIKKM